MEEESTSCYCLLDTQCCNLLVDRPGCYALVGEALTQAAGKRLRRAAFGNMEPTSSTTAFECTLRR